MKWLLWREYRLNRPILITSAALLILPYVFALFMLVWFESRSGSAAYILYGNAAGFSLILTQMAIVLLGGNAIAGERADRSTEFISYLPLSRSRRLNAKLCLAFLVVLSTWGFNLLVLLAVVSSIPEGRNYVDYQFAALSYIATTGLIFYGVSWMISSFQSSPTFAVAAGLSVPLIIVVGLERTAWMIGPPDIARFMSVGYFGICLPIAIGCFCIGTWYYLRRGEP